MNSLNKIENALAILALVLKFYARCSTSKPQITPSFFCESTEIQTGGPGLTLEKEVYSQETLEGRAFNLFLSALGTLLITVCEACDEIWGKLNKKIEGNLEKARMILYMLRCAFAHGPFEPKWCIKKDYQLRVEVLFSNGNKMVFDGFHLNGKNLKFDDIGGLENLITIIKYIYEEGSCIKK